MLTAGGRECSSIEPEPFFGANEDELQECVDEGFDLLSYVEVTFNGTTTTDLDDYVVTTELDTLAARTTCSARMPASPGQGLLPDHQSAQSRHAHPACV